MTALATTLLQNPKILVVVVVSIVAIILALGGVVAQVWGGATKNNELRAAGGKCLYALVLVQAKDKMTAPIGLTAYVVGDTFYWGQMMAAATILSLPPLLLYLFGQRWVIQGWTAGAVKS